MAFILLSVIIKFYNTFILSEEIKATIMAAAVNFQLMRNLNRSSRLLRVTRFITCERILSVEFPSPAITNNVKYFHVNRPLLSDEHNNQNMRETLDKEEKLLETILDASLEEVITHGWSLEAVKTAVARLGLPAVSAGLVDSVDQLVLHHIHSANRRLDTWMEAEVARLTADGQRLKIGPFVRSCIVQRLSMNIPLLEAGLWAEGVARVVQPGPGLAEGVGAWQTVCDDIWWRAGDSSADLNWYTKRISLGAVMAATEVFMLQDTSDNFQETWQFLDRRLADLALAPTLSKIPEDVAKVAEGLFQTAKILVGAQK